MYMVIGELVKRIARFYSKRLQVFDIAQLLYVSYKIKSLLLYVVVDGEAEETSTHSDS